MHSRGRPRLGERVRGEYMSEAGSWRRFEGSSPVVHSSRAWKMELREGRQTSAQGQPWVETSCLPSLFRLCLMSTGACSWVPEFRLPLP